jgi:hypothetical protein
MLLPMLACPPLFLYGGASLARGGIANHVLAVPLSTMLKMAEAVRTCASRAQGRELNEAPVMQHAWLAGGD